MEWRAWRCEGAVESGSGETHWADLEKADTDRPPLRDDPRGFRDELGQVTHGCINPFPSLAYGDRREERGVGAQEVSL